MALECHPVQVEVVLVEVQSLPVPDIPPPSRMGTRNHCGHGVNDNRACTRAVYQCIIISLPSSLVFLIARRSNPVMFSIHRRFGDMTVANAVGLILFCDSC